MKSLKNIPTIIFNKLTESGSIDDILDAGKRLWEHLTKNYDDSEYSDETPDVIAKTLHKMQTGSAPRIALVGMTSAGKSSLINALFGKPISEVKRSADTTNCVLVAAFPSGLLIYDTPGLAGDEDLGYENITRLFLNLQQEDESKQFSSVPFQENTSNICELSPEELEQMPLLDAVLFLVDISRTLNKYEKKALKSFFYELKHRYDNRVVVAGTHLDELNKLSLEESQTQLDSYNKIFDNQLIPISSKSGEGLSELVINLFQIMPQKVAPAKLQESLTATKKLNRLSFVITESSHILTELILLKGNQGGDIQAGYLWLFALICKHYSVDEDTWIKCNGDALKIGNKAKEAGIKKYEKSRPPKGFFEKIRAFFGKEFKQDAIEHQQIGIQGLKELLPGVYGLLYGFADIPIPEVSDKEIHRRIDSKSSVIKFHVEQNRQVELASKIGEILQELFKTYS